MREKIEEIVLTSNLEAIATDGGDVSSIDKASSNLLFLFQSEMGKNVGMLRQWLNEDRITDPKKMVTNEEIKKWLELEG